MGLGDGEEGGDCRTEDVVTSGGVVLLALFKMLNPCQDKNQDFWHYEGAGPWGEEVPDISPPGSGEPVTIYIHHIYVMVKCEGQG